MSRVYVCLGFFICFLKFDYLEKRVTLIPIVYPVVVFFFSTFYSVSISSYPYCFKTLFFEFYIAFI